MIIHSLIQTVSATPICRAVFAGLPLFALTELTKRFFCSLHRVPMISNAKHRKTHDKCEEKDSNEPQVPFHGREFAERLELSHAGEMMSTANAGLRTPSRVGCSDLLGISCLSVEFSDNNWAYVRHSVCKALRDAVGIINNASLSLSHREFPALWRNCKVHLAEFAAKVHEENERTKCKNHDESNLRDTLEFHAADA